MTQSRGPAAATAGRHGHQNANRPRRRGWPAACTPWRRLAEESAFRAELQKFWGVFAKARVIHWKMQTQLLQAMMSMHGSQHTLSLAMTPASVGSIAGCVGGWRVNLRAGLHGDIAEGGEDVAPAEAVLRARLAGGASAGSPGAADVRLKHAARLPRCSSGVAAAGDVVPRCATGAACAVLRSSGAGLLPWAAEAAAAGIGPHCVAEAVGAAGLARSAVAGLPHSALGLAGAAGLPRCAAARLSLRAARGAATVRPALSCAPAGATATTRPAPCVPTANHRSQLRLPREMRRTRLQGTKGRWQLCMVLYGI